LRSFLVFILRLAPRSAPFPYTTLFRSRALDSAAAPCRVLRRLERPADALAGEVANGAGAGREAERCKDEPSDGVAGVACPDGARDRKSTRLNSSHSQISYAVFCLKKKN